MLDSASRPSNGVTLPALEQDLAGLLTEYAVLSQAQVGADFLRRVELEERADGTLERIAALHEAIARTSATDLAGAVVQLRRLEAMLDGDQDTRRRPASALRVVESGAARVM